MIFMATSQPKVPAPPGPIAPVKQPGGGGGEVVLERVPQKVKPPQMHQVVMLNDDYTPMEFVVVVIQEFFGKDRESATQIMLKIHLDGKGVCGVYTRDVAHTKVEQVLDAARQAGHPLQCVSEPVD
jgi:ATP-dependent Clp protease adaptor protein ClpS